LIFSSVSGEKKAILKTLIILLNFAEEPRIVLWVQMMDERDFDFLFPFCDCPAIVGQVKIN